MKGRKVVALLLVAVLLAAGHLTAVNCELSATFYADSCADVDTIVRNEVDNAMNQSAIVGPSVLRLFAHDCFISGCDGSILLQDSNTTSNVERDSPENQSLQQLAFDTINQIKQAVEAQCPGVVSCADILSMASQDVVNNMGGPSWVVLLGRRDGLNSTAASVPGHLPLANMSLAQISGIFDAMGLTNQDLVTLSGAHTVGFAHCDEFTDRLYNFNNVSNNGTDPSLSPSYAATLKGKCPDGSFSSTTVQALDTVTPAQFDNDYYQQLQIGQGLLSSDQVLFVDNSTTNLVTTYANNQARFFTNFVASMTAMSQVGVLTGTQGEIRQNCSAVNSGPTSLPPPSNSSTAPPVVPPPTPVLPPPSNSTPPPVLPPPAPVLPPPSNSSNSSTPPVVSPPAPVLPPPSNSSTPPVVSPPAPVLPPPSNSSAAPPPPANVSTPVLPPPTPVLPPPLNSSTPPPANVSTPIVPPPAPVVVPPPSNSSTPSPNVTTPVVPSSPPPAAASPPPPVPVKLPPPPPVVPSSPPPAAASPPPPVPVKLPPPPPVPAPPPPPIPEKPSPFPPTRPRVPPPAPKPSVPGPPGGR